MKAMSLYFVRRARGGDATINSVDVAESRLILREIPGVGNDIEERRFLMLSASFDNTVVADDDFKGLFWIWNRVLHDDLQLAECLWIFMDRVARNPKNSLWVRDTCTGVLSPTSSLKVVSARPVWVRWYFIVAGSLLGMLCLFIAWQALKG